MLFAICYCFQTLGMIFGVQSRSVVLALHSSTQSLFCMVQINKHQICLATWVARSWTLLCTKCHCHRTKDLDEPHAIAFLIFDSIGQVGFSFCNHTIFNYLNPQTLEIKQNMKSNWRLGCTFNESNCVKILGQMKNTILQLKNSSNVFYITARHSHFQCSTKFEKKKEEQMHKL